MEKRSQSIERILFFFSTNVLKKVPKVSVKLYIKFDNFTQIFFLGKTVLQQRKDGSIVNQKDESVFSGGNIDPDIFDAIFPGFDKISKSILF